MTTFKKAEKKQAKLKIALTGPSGSGKTYSALTLAGGLLGSIDKDKLTKRIALIDTENHSASLYADKFEFDTMELDPPYTVQKYIDGIKAAQAAGYEVLIIDSISHAWAGEGGLLAKKEALDSRGGNSYTNWGSITKEHEGFKAILLSADVHLVCTMRSKQDYVLETNDKGRQAPKKVGLAPVQRDGMEYEFTTVLDIAMDHNAQASKDRTSLFDGQIFKITKDTGLKLYQWLNSGSGKAIEPKSDPKPKQENKPISEPVKQTPEEDDVPLFSDGTQTDMLNEPDPGDHIMRFGKHEGKTVRSLSKAQLLDVRGAIEEVESKKGHIPPRWLPEYTAVCRFVEMLG